MAQPYSASESTQNNSQNPVLDGDKVSICVSGNQVQIQRPDFVTDKPIHDISEKREILAKDLLEEWEAVSVQKQGILFAVSVGDSRYLVRGHDRVPANAVVVRTQSNQLMGIGAVVGG